MNKNLFTRILNNKVCIVTGGRTGIGRTIVSEFLKQGAFVIVFGRDMHKLKESFRNNRYQNKKLFLFEADIKDYDQLKLYTQRIKEKFNQIDVLVNNASFNFMIAAEKLKPNMIDLSIDTNLKGHLYLSVLVANQMKFQRGIKKIINITAYSGGNAYPGFSHFHACKAGLDALTKTLAVEWSKYKILVNSVCPGPVLTKNFIHAYSRLKRIQGYKKSYDLTVEMKKIVPLGEFIPAIDIVNTVLFLASDFTNNMTGQIIAVDGGVGIKNEFLSKELNS